MNKIVKAMSKIICVVRWVKYLGFRMCQIRMNKGLKKVPNLQKITKSKKSIVNRNAFSHNKIGIQINWTITIAQSVIITNCANRHFPDSNKILLFYVHHFKIKHHKSQITSIYCQRRLIQSIQKYKNLMV